MLGLSLALAALHDDALSAGLRGLDPAVPGCAMGVYDGGRLVASRAVGVATRGGAPLDARTSLRIASTSKQFTAASILLLAADGAVDLDDPVTRWIPELAPHPPVTLRQLVHHTSGVRDYLALFALMGPDEPDDLGAVLAVLARQQAGSFPAGTDHAYSNSGYLLLGEVVARASGSSLRSYAEERLFTPLGMGATRFLDDASEAWPTRARGYDVRGRRALDVDTTSGLVGDGGVYTSIEDLAGWMHQLDADPLGIRDAQLDRPVLPDGTELAYAAGLVHGSFQGLPMVSHAGSYAGFRADLAWFPDQRLGIACLCNRGDGEPSGRIREAAAVLLDDVARAVAAARPPAAPLPAGALDPLVGVYVLSPGVELAVTAADGILSVQLTGQGPVALVPEGPLRFLAPEVGAVFTFEPSEQASPAVRLEQGGNDLRLPRRAPLPPAGDHSGLGGRWWSDELEQEMRLALKRDALVVRLAVGSIRLPRTDSDAFASEDGVGVRVLRASDGAVQAVALDLERAEGMRFVRR